MSTYTKMGKQGCGGGGGFVREGFCPAPNTDITRSCPASQPLDQSKKKLFTPHPKCARSRKNIHNSFINT